MPSALPVTLAAVSCASPRICVAVGGQAITVPLASIAARTTDGGTEWASTLFGAASAQVYLPWRVQPHGVALRLEEGPSAPVSRALRSALRTVAVAGASPTCQRGSAGLQASLVPSWGSALPSVPPSWTDCPASRWYPHDLVSHWKVVALPAGEKGLALVTCSTQEHCIAVGGDPWGPARPSSPRRTRGGPEGLAQCATRELGGASWRGGISCPGVSQCFIVGDSLRVPDGEVRRDTSGPVRMVERIGPLSAAGRHELLDDCRLIVTAAHCVAVGGGVLPRGGVVRSILTTTDGVPTWVSRVVPTLAAGLSGVSCSTAEECMAVGGASPAQARPQPSRPLSW